MQESLYDFISEDIVITPGRMLKICRQACNIPRENIANLLLISLSELDDIENDRRPFPAPLLGIIFAHGVPSWYMAMCQKD